MRRNWYYLISIVTFHFLALLGFFYTPRLVDLLLLFLFFIINGFGITIGFHRLLTHRAFECPIWLKRVFTWMGASALQVGVVEWVGTHRLHHKESDLQDDPHTPTKGFLYSHFGWFFVKREIDKERDLARNLLKDPFIRFVDRFPLLPWLSTAVFCLALGGWQGVLWGAVIRSVLFWHIEWSVNSFCHTFGNRAFETKEGSRNVWWLSLLTFGEAWHNNHHYNQSSAFHGFTNYQIDLSAYVIRVLEKLGLVWDVKRPKLAPDSSKKVSTLEAPITE